jgi:hypothetical protein
MQCSLEMSAFKAADGDCILLQCRSENRSYKVLVDGGRGSTLSPLRSFFRDMAADDRRIDLFVVSHIDSDHIAGAISIAGDPELAPMVQEIWFNGPQHLFGDGNRALSIAEGDELIRLIGRNGWAWNKSFQGKAAMRRAEASTLLPAGADGPSLRLLGPYPEALRELGSRWTGKLPTAADRPTAPGVIAMGGGDESLNVLTLAGQRYAADGSVVNATSIAFVLRYGGRSVAICADSHAETLERSIDEDFQGKLNVDIATLPHHGSSANMSVALSGRLQAKHWIVSTDGGRGAAKKPNGSSIARILMSRRPSVGHLNFVFNSDHAAAKLWDNEKARADFNYSVRYAAATDDRIAIFLT